MVRSLRGESEGVPPLRIPRQRENFFKKDPQNAISFTPDGEFGRHRKPPKLLPTHKKNTSAFSGHIGPEISAAAMSERPFFYRLGKMRILKKHQKC